MAQRFHSKWKTLAAMLAALTAGSLIMIGAMSMNTPGEAPPLLIVNGQETSTAEFNWHLQLNRALTADYFMQTYHAGYSEDFWLTDYSGEIPLQRWIRDAQTQLLTKQAELQLAEEAGVIPDISFEAFLIGMERENIRRSQAAVNKEVVYGPKQLDAQAYYSYYMSNLEDATIDAMRRNGSIVITAEQERLEYEANLAAKYSKQGTTRVEWVTLPYGPESEYKDQSGAMDRMKELLAAVTAGRESTGTELTGTTLREQAEELGVYTRELTVTSTSRRTAALENPLVLLAAEQLAQGQVSSLIVENGAVHLLYCLSEADPEALPFNQVKDRIAQDLAQQKFRALVDHKRSEAVVEWNNQMAEDLARQAIQ
ncbi:hypothetical protein NSS64_12820 [Paenibacillus sp. FSL H8-0122]|uniref:peptidylprolyl isomerase n=1 Tax=Paenibacillus sp. FSL H8-0122 TaxID=2954510 RepID=UPI0030F673BE